MMGRFLAFLGVLGIGAYLWEQTQDAWSFSLGAFGYEGGGERRVADRPDSLGPDPWPEIGYETPISAPVMAEISGQVASLEPEIRAASERADVPSDLIAVVIQQESAGRATAHNTDGEDSYGLGQIQEGAAKDVNEMWGSNLDRTDPAENIFLTAGYLRWLRDHWFPWWAPMQLTTWYQPVRAYMCGLQGAKEYADCGQEEAEERISLANLD